MKNLELKYPEAFDKVIVQELKSKSSRKQKQLSKLLGFKPSVAHTIQGSSLFENLNHVNPSIRVQAVEYISKKFDTLKEENIDFVRESVINRFYDEDPTVVAAALEIPSSQLHEILSEADLSNVFIKVICRDLRNYKKWKAVVKNAITKFCSMDNLPVTQDIVLVVLPHLFPYDSATASISFRVINSSWGKKFALTKNIKGLNASIAQDNHKVILQMMFKALLEKKYKFEEVLDVNLLDKSNTTDVCFFLLLKSCSFNEASVDDLTNVLNLLLEAVGSREIIPSLDGQSFENKHA